MSQSKGGTCSIKVTNDMELLRVCQAQRGARPLLWLGTWTDTGEKLCGTLGHSEKQGGS